MRPPGRLVGLLMEAKNGLLGLDLTGKLTKLALTHPCLSFLPGPFTG